MFESETIEKIIVGLIVTVGGGVILWLILHRRTERRKTPMMQIPMVSETKVEVTMGSYENGKAPEAAEIVRRRPRLKKEYTDLLNYLKRGDAEFHNKNFKTAGNFYMKSLGLARILKDYDLLMICLHELGASLGMQGRHDDAEKYFSIVLEMDPNHSETYCNRGLAHGRKGDYDRAIKDFNQAIKLNPNYAIPYNNRGIAYARKGDYDRAIKDFNQVIKMDQNYAKAYNNRGIAYARKGDYDRAIKDFNQAIKMDQNYAKAYNNRGNAYGDKGEYDRAIEDYNKALKLDPNSAEAMANMGAAYLRKDDPKNGLHWLNEALKRRDQLPDKGKMILEILESLKPK